MTRADLVRKWASLVELCEGTFCRPEDALKVNGISGSIPSFCQPGIAYEFAVAIIEDEAIFEYTEVYHKATHEILCVRAWHGAGWLSRNYSLVPF
jgi:hypothetical protein